MTKTSFLGVDLGTFGVKVVELQKFKGQAQLVTYGFSEGLSGDLKSEAESKNIAKTLKDICRQAETSSTQAITALPTFDVFSAVVSLPPLRQKELAQAVAAEAKKISPLPPADYILDSQILEKFELTVKVAESTTTNTTPTTFHRIISQPAKSVSVLITGAPKNLVQNYLQIFKQADLNLLSLETESFALRRSLLGNDQSTVMMVDWGATTSSMMVLNKGVPVFSRSLQAGGISVSKLIGQKLGISFKQAEQFKQDAGLNTNTPAASVIESAISPIVNEIKYSLNLFQERYPLKVEKIILTGGAAQLIGLTDYLSRLLNLRVSLGDPWSRIFYPQELKPLLDNIGSKMAIAVGLALRNLEEG